MSIRRRVKSQVRSCMKLLKRIVPIVLLLCCIRVEELYPKSLNDLSVEKCKGQIFSLDIFGKCNIEPDFKHMLHFKVISFFLSWVDQICFPQIIFCTSFQSGEGLKTNGILLLVVWLDWPKVLTIFFQSNNKLFLLKWPLEIQLRFCLSGWSF